MRAWARATMIGVIGVTLIWAVPADAQRRGGVRQDREQLERRIRAQMGRLMRERLGLTEEQAQQLSEVVQGFEAQRRDLFRQEQATRRRVEALLLEGDPGAREATELLDRMAELRAQEAELFAQEQGALLGVLTPMQLLELYSLREQIGRRIRALRGGRDDGPAGRRRRGGPAPPGAGLGMTAWGLDAGLLRPGR